MARTANLMFLALIFSMACGDCASEPPQTDLCGRTPGGGGDGIGGISGPQFVVSADSVALDEAGEASFYIFNVGKGCLVLSNAETSVSTLQLDPIDLPVPLDTDESLRVNVSGSSGGQVLLYTNAPDFEAGIARVEVTADSTD